MSIDNQLSNSAFATSNKPKLDKPKLTRTVDRTYGVNNGVNNTSNSVVQNDVNDLDHLLDTETKRPTKHYPFSFYVDQLDALERLDKRSRNKSGKSFNKSKYVRDAVDKQMREDGLL